MASVVLGTVGSIIGGPFGGALGAAVGGYVDQNFLFPALFPAQTIEGPRLNELKLQSADEGTPANFIVGGLARVAGTIIWISDIVETANEEEAGGGKGGGGGGGQSYTTYTYSVDLALAIAMQPGVTVQKIYAEGKLLYNANPNVALSSSAVAVSLLGIGSKRRMKISTTSSAIDLTALAIGYDVTIAGFTNAANNGTFKVLSTTKNRSTGETTVIVKNTSCVTESAGASVTFAQTLPPFDTAKVQDIAFYGGSSAQAADALISAYEGAANTPGFIGTAYVVLQGLALADFGNRVPQLSVLADVGGATVAAAITACYTRTGRSSSEIDVTGLSGSMDGYATTGPFSPINALQPLALAFDVLAQEANGSFRFFHRRNATIVEVDETDLAAHEFGDDASRPLEIEENPKSEGPSEANVKHVDLEAENQAGSQRERRRDFASDGVINIDLPIAMTGAKARGIARRLLWVAWANRKRFRLQLPPRYMQIQENDCLRLKSLGQGWLLLVQKIDAGQNGVLLVEAVLEVRDVLTQVEEADPPYSGSTSLAAQADDSEVQIGEFPNYGNGNGQDEPIITTAVSIEDPTIQFPGCQVFEADEDEDESYRLWDSIGTEAKLGFATTILSGSGVSSAYWDRVSTVDVYVFKGTLANADEDLVLNGWNRAILGDEIIGFATATLVGTNTYRLSNLLRGLRNTEASMATHALAERFALLSNAIKSKPCPLAWIGKTKHFRFVFASQALADAETQTLAITGRTLKPFAPASLGVSKDDYGNISATIVRRSRALTRLFSPALPPLYEASEKYSIDVVYPAGSGTIVRTIAANGTNAFTYNEGQQTTDGVTPFDPIEYRVYQLSEIYGRGEGLVVVA